MKDMNSAAKDSTLGNAFAGEEKHIGQFRMVMRRLNRNHLAMVGLGILVFMFLFSFLGPFLSPYGINDVKLVDANQPPNAAHWLGTDESGRDILTRLMHGGRISMLVGVAAQAVTVLLGVTLGMVAGYYRGWTDAVIMRIADILMCMPYLITMIVLSVIFSDLGLPSQYRVFMVLFILGFLGWPGLSRLVRSTVLSLREQEFMLAADAMGLRDRRKIFRHLLPNVMAPVIVSATLGVAGAILTESSLSFLGLGVTPPTPTWGNMVQSARDMYTLQRELWKWIPPSVCIALTVLAINLLGDGLRDALDPKLKD